MTVIRLQDGKAIVEDGKVGISEECCCQRCSDYDHCVINTAANNNGSFVVGCAEFDDNNSFGSGAGNLCLASDFLSCDSGLPTGWEWASGYPEAFGDCRFVFVFTFKFNDVACDDGGGCGYRRSSSRVWKLTPVGTLVDVTAEASADGAAFIQDQIELFGGCAECPPGEFLDPGECTPQLICGACCLDENRLPDTDECFENTTPYHCDNVFFGSFVGGFKLNERCADNPCEEPPP